MGHFLEMNQNGYTEFAGQGVHTMKLRARSGHVKFQLTETTAFSSL